MRSVAEIMPTHWPVVSTTGAPVIWCWVRSWATDRSDISLGIVTTSGVIRSAAVSARKGLVVVDMACLLKRMKNCLRLLFFPVATLKSKPDARQRFFEKKAFHGGISRRNGRVDAEILRKPRRFDSVPHNPVRNRDTGSEQCIPPQRDPERLEFVETLIVFAFPGNHKQAPQSRCSPGQRGTDQSYCARLTG